MLGFLKKLFGGSSTDYRALMDKGAVIIDVRSAAEFRDGHIPGSRNIPLEQVGAKAAELKKAGKPVITVCRSGNRSGMAKAKLRAAGIDEVYNGGGWQSLITKI
jgi:rhodanese-related sulfurtransferase